MTALQIDPNSAEYRESIYVIDEALYCISTLARQLSQTPLVDPAYINDRLHAIGHLSDLSERLLGILRCYGAGSALKLALLHPLVRHEVNRIRDTFRA